MSWAGLSLVFGDGWMDSLEDHIWDQSRFLGTCMPPLPWVRFRVWIGAGLVLVLREGWVDILD